MPGSLATNVTDLATAVATAVKDTRNRVGDLASLSTTDKTSTVAAINEVDGRVDVLSGSAAGIDDTTTSPSSTWSSTKTSNEITAASTADRDRANHTGTQSADTVVDGTTNHVFTADDDTKLAGIAAGATANATDAYLLDRTHHTNTQPASTITGLAAVATSGVYTDLSGTPTIPASYSDLSGTVPQSALPAVALTEFLGAVASETAMLALSGQRGDWATRTDLGTDWQLIADDASVLASWREMTYPASPVSSVNGRTGAVTGLAEAADVAAEIGDLGTFDPVATFNNGLV